jgi:biotin-(acetyl-CoA carboxylase) ligase
MKKKAMQLNEEKHDVRFSPTLDAAIAAWEKARHEFENERSKNHQDAYVKATDELGQAIAGWQGEQSELAGQFGLWFESHQGAWSV